MAFLFLSVVLVYIAGAAASETNVFKVPGAAGPGQDYGQNPEFPVYHSVQLSWTMNFTYAKLTIAQEIQPARPVGGTDAVILGV